MTDLSDVIKDINLVTMLWVDFELNNMDKDNPVNYKKQFEALVEELCNTSKEEMPTQEVRNCIIRQTTEQYFNVMHEYPTPYTLDRLSNYCLLDIIKSVNKKKTDEDRFLSDKQLHRRMAREYSIPTNDTLFDFLYSKYELKLDSLSKVAKMEVATYENN